MNSENATRLGLFLPGLHGGGAERVTLNLARGLAEEGYEVDLVLAGATGPYLTAVPEGARVVDLRARRTASALFPLARYLRQQRPDALLSALNHANVIAVWAAALARYRRPLLVAEHNELHEHNFGTTSGRALLLAMRWTYPRATKIVAVSEGVKASLLRRLPLQPDAVQVIYNPVLLPENAVAARETPDHPFFGAGKPPTVLGIGRLTRQKNFTLLVRAFALVRKRRDVRLLILGEGEERPALEQLIAAEGIGADVALPGFVMNPHAYLGAAGVFALSSDWEGLPTVLIEALAAGCPTVSTNCPSGPEEILAGGRLGRLVPVGDVTALADAIDGALTGRVPAVDASELDRFTLQAAARNYAEAMGVRAAHAPPFGGA